MVSCKTLTLQHHQGGRHRSQASRMVVVVVCNKLLDLTRMLSK
jgi:hypothetical protein